MVAMCCIRHADEGVSHNHEQLSNTSVASLFAYTSRCGPQRCVSILSSLRSFCCIKFLCANTVIAVS